MKRLGQFLLELGWIGTDDLARALKSQEVLGGRLGTCLLEMGVLSEELLLKALSHQLGVEATRVQDLEGVPSEVYGLLPAKVALRCEAVPFRMLGSEIYIAMLDVNNLRFHDDLAFATDKQVRAHVANEVRIHQALDNYYGFHASTRFKQLAALLDSSEPIGVAGLEATAVKISGIPIPSREAGGTLDPATLIGGSPLVTAPNQPRPEPPAAPDPAPPPPPAIAPEPLPSTASDATAAANDNSAGGAATDELFTDHRAAAAPAVDAHDGSFDTHDADRDGSPATFEDLGRQLAEIDDRDSVGHVIVDYLAERFDKVGLFMVRKGEVSGWMGAGDTLDREQLLNFRLSLDEPSVFLNLSNGGMFYAGALPPMPSHMRMAKCWAADLPGECLVLPVRVRDRLVSALFCHPGVGGLEGVDMEEMSRLSTAAGAAFQHCIVVNKRGKNKA